ncbi:MAG: hypothetical protein AB8B72_14610 [Crocinitomicaceae bacterium]
MKIPVATIFFFILTALSCETSKPIVEEAKVQTPISDCINSTNRNISKAELNLNRLKKLSAVDTSQDTFRKEAVKYKTMLQGLDSTIASCKKSEPEYDFTEIDAKVNSIKDNYEQLMDSIN